MEGDPAIDHLSTFLIPFITRVIDQQIHIETAGEIDQGGEHLHPWTNGIQQIRSLIERLIRPEDVITDHFNRPGGARRLADIGADDPAAGSGNNLRRFEIGSHAHLNHSAISRADITGDAPFNTFIRAHH